MFYTDEFKKSVLKKRNIYIIAIVIFAAALMAFNVFTFIYLNRDNALAMQITITIIDTLSLIAILYMILNPLMREVHYLRHIKLITRQTKDINKVKVVEILKDKITISNDIICYEIIVEENETQRSLYLLNDFNISLLKEGEEYKLELCSSYIVGIDYEN